MPEGPECRKIAEQLAKRTSGVLLLGVEILGGRYKQKPPTGIDSATRSFPIGIIGAGVHGKFIYFIMKDEWSLWFTLGMTGGWSSDRHKHSRIKFKLDNGDLYFNDMRNFGTVKFVQGKFKLVEKLNNLGPDMLINNISDEDFIGRLREYSHWQITSAIMNQSIIAGVGNYIKCDSLWMAKINPHTIVKELSDNQLSVLSSSIKRVMRESLSSANARYDTLDNKESTDEEYNGRFLIYNKKFDPDGNSVVRELTQDNRTTHWCPEVQK